MRSTPFVSHRFCTMLGYHHHPFVSGMLINLFILLETSFFPTSRGEPVLLPASIKSATVLFNCASVLFNPFNSISFFQYLSIPSFLRSTFFRTFNYKIFCFYWSSFMIHVSTFPNHRNLCSPKHFAIFSTPVILRISSLLMPVFAFHHNLYVTFPFQ